MMLEYSLLFSHSRHVSANSLFDKSKVKRQTSHFASGLPFPKDLEGFADGVKRTVTINHRGSDSQFNEWMNGLCRRVVSMFGVWKN